MREIDGFLIDPVGSERGVIGGKTCATDESELRIEQGNIMTDFIWVCIARSIVDLVTQRNRPGSLELDGVNTTTLSMQRIVRLNAVDVAT